MKKSFLLFPLQPRFSRACRPLSLLFFFRAGRIIRNMKHLLYLNGKPIEYTLERKRVKNINLRVRGGEIFVSAPLPEVYRRRAGCRGA